VQGRDALPLLQEVSSNDLDVPTGRVVYTCWLNRRGGIESDLTVTRLDEDSFLVVTAGAQRTRDFERLRRHTRDRFATVADVSSAYATFSIMGPNSRALMKQLSPADFSEEGFAQATGREIDFGYGKAMALRMTYVGELGWELHIPTEFAQSAFDEVEAAGGELGLRLCGYQAIDSLRLEAGFRDWGHDVGPDDTPQQAGLAFTVAWDKPGGFVGREALLALKGQVPTTRLVQLALQDPEPWLFGTEPVWRNDELVGYVESGARGFTLGTSVGMAYLKCAQGVSVEWLIQGRFEVEVVGRRVAAHVSLSAWYDPKRRRARGESVAAADLVPAWARAAASR
jgi:glycine cleavage system aminomethyltransferase T